MFKSNNQLRQLLILYLDDIGGSRLSSLVYSFGTNLFLVINSLTVLDHRNNRNYMKFSIKWLSSLMYYYEIMITCSNADNN